MVALQIISDEVVKPCNSLPLLNTHAPLTIFDRATYHGHISALYAFKAPTPTNEEMIKGLRDALGYIPHLAGTLTVDDHGKQSILLNNAGARVVETLVTTDLSEHLPLDPCPKLTCFHPSLNRATELLQVQLNRFACRGLIIGYTFHHGVCDGQSISLFLHAWANLVRGFDVDPLPFLDRNAVSVPRSPPFTEFNHQDVEFKKVDLKRQNDAISVNKNLVVHLSSEFIRKLKSKVQDGYIDRSCTTFECLLAHLWKKVTIARRLDGETYSQVRVAVNGRARVKPSVPMEYFGNFVLWAYPRLKVKELIEESHAYIVKTIHDTISKVNDRYFKSFIDFGSLLTEKEAMELAANVSAEDSSSCSNLRVSSWLRFGFQEIDFGGGMPCSFLLPYLPFEGLSVFIPSCQEKGAVDVYIALSSDHADQFKQICLSLD